MNIKQLKRRLKRLTEQKDKLEAGHKGNEQKHTYHAGFSLGYLKGKIAEIENIIDEPKEENMKYLLEQDDCAPDSLEWFNVKLKQLTGLVVENFKSNGIHTEEQDGYIIKYTLNNYCLEQSASDPYWKLSKIYK